MTRIAIDAMGGDHAPFEIVAGAVWAAAEYGVALELVGKQDIIEDCLEKIEDTIISPYYRPFQWLPHTTIGKKLSNEEMQVAFQILQNDFSLFDGTVVKIGLAKTNPYTDIISWELKKVL